MMKFVDVLDHGHVEYVSHMGCDMTVVNAARVSFNKDTTVANEPEDTTAFFGTKLYEKDKKLIQYLAKHNHWTPFAHPQITLRIKAPIAIRTQLFKSKIGFTENEVSRRYVTYTPEIYQPTWRTKPTGGAKQGSEDFMPHDSRHEYICYAYHRHVNDAISLYEKLIAEGVAPEQARFVLPQGAYTEWWWTGSLCAYARVCKLRSDSHAQWEIRQYAEAISRIIQPIYPESWAALTT